MSTTAVRNVRPRSADVATTVTSRSPSWSQASVTHSVPSYATYSVPSRPICGLDPCEYGVRPVVNASSVVSTRRYGANVRPKSVLEATTMGDSR